MGDSKPGYSETDRPGPKYLAAVERPFSISAMTSGSDMIKTNQGGEGGKLLVSRCFSSFKYIVCMLREIKRGPSIPHRPVAPFVPTNAEFAESN